MNLHATSANRALEASKVFRGYPRAGGTGEGLEIIDWVEAVDASLGSAGLIGHSYFSEDRHVMEEIFGIHQTGECANGCFRLQAVESCWQPLLDLPQVERPRGLEAHRKRIIPAMSSARFFRQVPPLRL